MAAPALEIMDTPFIYIHIFEVVEVIFSVWGTFGFREEGFGNQECQITLKLNYSIKSQ
jgi:hypothetical protein